MKSSVGKPKMAAADAKVIKGGPSGRFLNTFRGGYGAKNGVFKKTVFRQTDHVRICPDDLIGNGAFAIALFR